MATRKMTFTIPDEIATPFLRAVPATRRSKFVADSLRKTLREREEALIAACDAVNADPELNALVDDWQTVNDPIEEPWDEPAPRDVWWVDLDPTKGSEVTKTRPCVILSANALNERRKTVVVVPLSTSAVVRPPITISVRSVGRPAVAVSDQIRAAAKEHFRSRMGSLSDMEMEAIEDGLRQVLGMA